MALAWVLAQGPRHGHGVAPIPGTKRVRYLEENVKALDVALDDEDVAELEQAIPRDAVVGDRYADMSSVNR
jgi:aryl-alcohol dehydrogenase-like predicted oxidoreductase